MDITFRPLRVGELVQLLELAYQSTPEFVVQTRAVGRLIDSLHGIEF